MIKQLISYTFILSIFCSSIMLNSKSISIDIYWYYPLFAFFLSYFFLNGLLLELDKKLLYSILIIFFLSIIAGNKHLINVAKQLVNLSFFILSSYAYLKYMKFDYDKIMKHYFVVAKVFVIFGFFQVIICALGFSDTFRSLFSFLTIPGSLTFRFQSFDREPSFAAYTLSLALLISVYNIIYRKNVFISIKWSYLFIIAYFLTFSLIAYIGIIILSLFFYFIELNFKRILLFIPFSLLFLSIIYIAYSSPSINKRINDTILAFSGSLNDISKVNQSTFAIYSNYIVTKSAISHKPIIGSGLGTHELNFNKYAPLYIKNHSEINKKEAASLTLRLLSECGLVGFLLFLGFILKNKIKFRRGMNDNEIKFWLINNGIFLMILLRLIRQGHYTVSGFIFFLLLFYFTNKSLEKASITNDENTY